MSNSHRPYNGLTFADAVQAEREYQDQKWGERGSHPWYRWYEILREEMDEVRREAARVPFDGEIALDSLRAELIQVAAVSAAIIEHIEEVRQAPA